MAFLWCLVSAAVLSFAAADYDCICNYNVELEVHNEMTDSSTPVGSLYEFDCKETLMTTKVDSGWAAIAYEHNIRYVKTGPNTETQTCPGNAPDSDRVSTATTGSPVTKTTTMLPTTVTTTPTPTPVTTTPIPTTVTTTPIPTTATTTPNPTTVTTTPIPTTVTTTPAPTTTTTTTTTMTTRPVTFAPSTTTTVATTQPTTTTSSTTTSSTTNPPTTTTTQAGIISGHTNLCPVALRSFTASDGGVLAQYDKSCYELVRHSTSWTHAETDCKTKGAHLVQINTQGEQDFIYNLIKKNYNHNTWIGLHDRNNETYFEWTSGETVVYTNWFSGKPPHHSSQDCVYLSPHDGGHWDDGDCGASGGFLFGSSSYTRPYICQYEIDTSAQGNGTVNHHGDGNTHLCPSTIVHHASNHHGFLGQYGQSCYELLPRYDVSWVHGERLCQQEGGHLAHITNADEQSFIQEFITNHMPIHGAWIGLNDRGNEGHFVWSSGVAVAYTNWAKGHTGNWDSPGREDCALFLPYANGHWDDLPCGSSSAFFGDTGESHPIICQFGITHASPAIG